MFPCRKQYDLRMRRFPLLLALLFLSLACDSAAPHVAPISYPETASSPPEQSLFSSDASVLSDEQIARILAFNYRPAERNRIAVLALGSSSYVWSDELARME